MISLRPLSLVVSLMALTTANLSGCALFLEDKKILEESTLETPGKRGRGSITRTPTEQSPRSVEKLGLGIEVTWEKPSEPVDGFVIRYGESQTALGKEKTVKLTDLKEERDSHYGPVYRYILDDVSKDATTYVSIAAFKGDVISDFSDAVADQANRR